MTIEIYHGNCLDILPTLQAGSVRTCVTSPPYYGLRDYGVDGQLGLEATPQDYVSNLVVVFAEVWRVLADDGTLWLNLGDSYATGTRATRQQSTGLLKHHTAQDIQRVGTPEGLKTKDLMGIPWRVAFALQDFGWYLRSDIIWHKPNCMPESVKDRPTKAHEYLFLLSKQERYYYDGDAIREKATSEGRTNNASERHGEYAMHRVFTVGEYRNKRTVWTIPTTPYSGAHFAVFPAKLIEPCILAGSAKGDTVLDPFGGSMTTGQVAIQHGRRFVGIELNADYITLGKKRLAKTQLQLI